MVGGMSRVVQDVPPYCLAAGLPLRVYDINKIGLRRRGIELATRSVIREIYKVLYGSGLTFREALAEVAESARGFGRRITQDWHKAAAVAEADI
mgnify:CR=1 FL=1